MRQFLPSIVRGAYRFDEQLSTYLKADDASGFILTKKAFLPRHYLAVIEKLIDLPVNEAVQLQIDYPPLSRMPNGGKDRANCFFLQHPCLATENNNNYLERQFIEKILTRVFPSINLFEWVKPQYPVNNYRLDFAIFGEKKFAIEVDGFGKFKQRSDLDSFVRRQNDIIAEDWTLYRFSYADVIENTAVTIERLKDVFRQDAKLNDLLTPAYQTSHQANLFDNDGFKQLGICHIVDTFYAIQDYFFIQVIETDSPSQSIFINEQLEFSFSLVSLALSDLYYFLESISQVFDTDIKLPEVILDKSLFKETKKFIKSDKHFLHPKIKLSTSQENGLLVNHVVLKETITELRYSYQAIQPINFRNTTGENSIQEVHTKLGYLAKSIFGYNEIRHEQDEILRKILNTKDVLGLLPTGSGKSFCFWLPALIKPGLTIIISPLKALMRDQDISLKLFGIYSTAFINSDIDNFQRQAIYTDIKLGRIRLLYISPERMQIKSFMLELNEILQFVPINFLVIDEAHCVSEWGHDFRPSFLRIPDFSEKLRTENLNSNMTIIALTATAGEIVKKDMMTILKLSESHVVSAKNFNRANLSIQFVTVNNYTEKAEQYKQVLKKYLPTALHKNNVNEIFQSDDINNKGVGLVFCIYADSHGKYSINDSVAHYLRESQSLIENNNKVTLDDFSTGKIRGFSSKTPTLCPNCTSSEYISNRKSKVDLQGQKNITGEKFCTNCALAFPEGDAITPNNWTKTLRHNQEAFKSSEIDLLVSTKGFGMGIDKGSVRFVVHTSMAGGMEGWYQEAGRAGRDGHPAHCVSIVDIPNQACLSAMASTKNIPDCTQTKCPHGKNGLCDYGKQHVFIQKSYPSIAADTMTILRCLDDLITKHDDGENPLILSTSIHYLKNHEVALYRLKILGVIDDYDIEYRSVNVSIEVFGFKFNVNESMVKNNLKSYLHIHDLKNKNITIEGIEKLIIINTSPNIDAVEDRIKKDQEKDKFIHYQQQPDLFSENQYDSFYKLIMSCSFVILDHIYTDIRGMRYDMLGRLRLLIQDQHHCRRVGLLGYFETEDQKNGNSLLDENYYKCGFCDVCQPDLNFTKNRSEPLRFNDDLSELDREFRDWLVDKNVLNIDTAEFYIKALINLPINTYAKATRILDTSNPRNLKALYIARHFSGQDEKQKYSLRLMETANLRKSLELETVLRIYQSTEDYLKPEALKILCDELGMMLNSVNGELSIYQEAEELFDRHQVDKETVEMLGARVIANDIKNMQFANQVTKLNDTIKAFTNE